MKPIRLSTHAALQTDLRGTSKTEIETAISNGIWEHARMGKFQTKYIFDFNKASLVNNKFYRHKTVAPVFAEEADEIVVITVKVFYSNSVEVRQ